MMDLTEYYEFRAATEPSEAELAVGELRRLRRICGSRYLWLQICPQTDGRPLTLSDVCATAERLARAKGFLRAARTLKTPAGPLAGIYATVPGYSEGYWGNPVIPKASPRKIVAWSWKVWARAGEILRPYGWRPSRAALRAAIISHSLRRVGRVAVQVAAASLPRFFGGGLYSDARRGANQPDRLPKLRVSRTILANARGWKSLRRRWAHDPEILASICGEHNVNTSLTETEARVLEIAFQPVDEAGMIPGRVIATRHGITVRECWEWRRREGRTTRLEIAVNHDAPLRSVTLIERGNLTYHATAGRWSDADIRQALRAWTRQRDADAKARQVAGFEARALGQASGPATVVVLAADSLRAGNCLPGTRHWAANHGGYQHAMPWAVAVRYAGEYRVSRVLALVASTGGENK